MKILLILSLLGVSSAFVGRSHDQRVQPSFLSNKRLCESSSSRTMRSSRRRMVDGMVDDGRMDGYYPGQFLINKDKEKIAFNELYMGSSNELVIFLPNLGEERDNPTSDAVLKFCIRRERNFLTADWFGRGDSTGKLMKATLSRWKQDIITILDNVPTHVTGKADFRKAVFVGHGVGVWVAVLVALERPDLVRGLVGIGGDPDFTEDLLWKQLPEETKEAIMRDGFREIEWGKLNEVYPITSTLIEDGRNNLVLRGGTNSLNIRCPVRLIHNLEDKEVPAETSIRLAECIASPDVIVNMPKFGTLGVSESIDQCFSATPDMYEPRYESAETADTA